MYGCGNGVNATTMPFISFGDSITVGYTLSPNQAYPYLVASALNTPLSNRAVSGDQACDIFPRQIYPHSVGYVLNANPVYSVMIGTNDVDVKGPGAYEANFNNCQSAVLTWLGTQPSDRLLPGNPSLNVTGGCENKPSSSVSGAILCAGNTSGSITTSDFITNGQPIYIWYGFGDDSPVSAAFTASMDATTPQSVVTHPMPAIATENGTHNSIGLLRLPVAAGTHTITIHTATGGISILAIGTNRSTRPVRLAIGDLPNQLLTNPGSSVANQLIYSADIQSNVNEAIADGIDARFVPDRTYMLGTAEEMNDQLHPNALGQQHLATAFLSVLPLTPHAYSDTVIEK
jgi:lysophospholipase L1-like esterase